MDETQAEDLVLADRVGGQAGKVLAGGNGSEIFGKDVSAKEIPGIDFMKLYFDPHVFGQFYTYNR
jgi:hypothetical protein